jgi:hypothetical protein
MTCNEKIYHIYAKNICLFHSLKESEFQATWEALNRLVSVLDTGYNQDDLSYEELLLNKEAVLNSSH